MMVIVIDNYDSFVHNLARYVGQLGYSRQVHRNNSISLSDISQLNPSHIIISPGPCTPNEAGISLEAIKYFAGKIPILGVCLGHQAIGQAFGGEIIKAKNPMHGMSSEIQHLSTGIFKGLSTPLRVGRYHSLVVAKENLPECLEITAHSSEGEIMALQHKSFPVFGVQFHPESVLTQEGYELLNNFLDVKV
jgi:para-aminobenzoate synthetase component II